MKTASGLTILASVAPHLRAASRYLSRSAVCIDPPHGNTMPEAHKTPYPQGTRGFAQGFLQCRLSQLGGQENLQAHLRDLVLELFNLVDMPVLVFKNPLKNFAGGKIFCLPGDLNGVIV